LHLNNPDLYSVRFNGRRVSSVCLRDKVAKEIKGPWNKAVESNHRDAVFSLLDKMQTNWQQSSDMQNIGRKIVNMQIGQDKITLLVSEKDSLYHYPSNYIDLKNIFEGVKFSEREQAKDKVLDKLSDGVKQKVRSIVDDAEKSYKICPLTDYMIPSYSDYSQYQIGKVANLINQYPEYKELWCQAVEKVKEEKNRSFYPNMIFLAGANLIKNFESIPGDIKKTRGFLQAMASIDYNLKLHPGFFNPILGKSETINDLYSKISYYTKLNVISGNMDDLLKIKKNKDPDYDADKFDIDEPEKCSACDNYSRYEDQNSLKSEYESKDEEIK
jgi:hypothetical protein